MHKPSAWFILYFIDVAVDVFFVLTNNHQGRLITKTLLMPLLFMAFVGGVHQWSAISFIFSLALCFSWLGDIMLMFDREYPILFIAGLGSFLIAHICYIVFFLRIADRNKIKRARGQITGILAISLYVIAMLYLLWPGLGSLKFPVVIYALTIGSMLLSTMRLSGRLPNKVFYFFLCGAVLFVISDSMLAFNKFRQSFVLASPAIMITYCAAQYLLTAGAIKYLRSLLLTAR